MLITYLVSPVILLFYNYSLTLVDEVRASPLHLYFPNNVPAVFKVAFFWVGHNGATAPLAKLLSHVPGLQVDNYAFIVSIGNDFHDSPHTRDLLMVDVIDPLRTTRMGDCGRRRHAAFQICSRG